MGKQIVEGTIGRIFVKDFGEADQYGNQYAVNIQVDNEWYGLGKKRKPEANIKHNGGWHKLAEGDTIEAVAESVERNGRTYNNIKVADVTLKSAATQNGGNGGASGNSGGSGGSPAASGAGSGAQMSQDDRQKAIMRQSAMGYAAQIVASTLTSKSSLDQAAEDVIAMADQFFLPYAEYGLTPSETRKQQENEVKNQQAQQQSQDDEEDFDDDIPF